MIRMKGDHQARTPSCFAVADRLLYPNAIQPASLAVVAGAYVKSVQQCAPPRFHSGCTQRRVDFALSIARPRAAARGEVRTREARQASRSEVQGKCARPPWVRYLVLGARRSASSTTTPEAGRVLRHQVFRWFGSEEVEPEPLGQELRDELAAHAVSSVIERRREGRQAALAG
jgi:hypothetical protein